MNKLREFQKALRIRVNQQEEEKVRDREVNTHFCEECKVNGHCKGCC